VPVRALPRQADERHHHRQVERFCAGDLSIEPRLTTFPGVHAVLAAAARPIGRCSDLAFLRLLNSLIGVAGVVLFHEWRARSGPRDLLRTAQFALLPVLAVHQAMVYTDALATTALLAGLLLVAASRGPAGHAVIGASLVFRQTNVAWLGFALLEEAGRRLPEPGPLAERARAFVRDTWPGLLTAVVFAGFVVLHGGFVLKERKAHGLGLHLGNAWLFLALVAIVLLPHALAGLRAVKRADLALAVGTGAAFFSVFEVEHVWNRFEGFLRNDVLLRLEADPVARGAAAAVVGLGVLALAGWVRERAIPCAYWPALALTVLTPSLVEHRYTVVPLALLMAWVPPRGRAVEVAAAAWCALLTGLLVYGRARGLFLV
jgi:hypothetical protein